MAAANQSDPYFIILKVLSNYQAPLLLLLLNRSPFIKSVSEISKNIHALCFI